jgi:hypothetical protein
MLKISGNPLISLDSVERIQGNPSFSNPQNLGFSRRNGTFQANPNRVDERRRDRLREGAKPTQGHERTWKCNQMRPNWGCAPFTFD